MRGVTVLGGHDGFDIRTCDDVLVEDCDFRTGDDCIAGFDNRNVTVRNCHFNCACTMLRFGGKSRDEFFVSAPAAAKGVTITNNSTCEPLVLLKHFPVYDGVPQ